MQIALLTDAGGLTLAPFRSGSHIVVGEVVSGRIGARRTLAAQADACCETLRASVAGCQTVLCTGISDNNARELAAAGIEIVVVEGEPAPTVEEVVGAYDHDALRAAACGADGACGEDAGCGDHGSDAGGCGGHQGCCGRHQH